MITASSFGARGFVIGASALMHVAVFAVAGTGGSKPADDNLALIEVSTIPVTEAVVEPKADAVEAAASHPHLHTHTHDYPVSPDHDATPHDESIVHTPFDAHAHSESQTDSPADAPSDVVSAPTQAPLPSFNISIGNAPNAHGAVQAAATGNGAAADPDHNHDDAPVAENGVSERAHAIRSVIPVYPADARSEEVEADVPLEIVVDKSGAVVSARAVSHIGYGFDESALVAIRQYKFSPAGRGGHAVAVRMPWTMQFRLK